MNVKIKHEYREERKIDCVYDGSRREGGKGVENRIPRVIGTNNDYDLLVDLSVLDEPPPLLVLVGMQMPDSNT